MSSLKNTNSNSYDEDADQEQKISCCTWFCTELSCCGSHLSMFSLRDVNGKYLDMERSFRFGYFYSSWIISLIKFVLFGICTYT